MTLVKISDRMLTVAVYVEASLCKCGEKYIRGQA